MKSIATSVSGCWRRAKPTSSSATRKLARAAQGVPLSQVIWAIILTKDNLWEFILDESYPDRPVEIFGKQELLQLLDQFFDRAIHATAVGYEWAAEAKVRAESRTRRAG